MMLLTHTHAANLATDLGYPLAASISREAGGRTRAVRLELYCWREFTRKREEGWLKRPALHGGGGREVERRHGQEWLCYRGGAERPASEGGPYGGRGKGREDWPLNPFGAQNALVKGPSLVQASATWKWGESESAGLAKKGGVNPPLRGRGEAFFGRVRLSRY